MNRDKKPLFFILVLISFSVNSGIALGRDFVCRDEFLSLAKQESVKDGAERALGRKISTEEEKALQREDGLLEFLDEYSYNTLKAQDTRLKEVGFSAQEIAALRKIKVLKNFRLQFAGDTPPSSIKIINTSLQPINISFLKSVKDVDQFPYIIDELGNIYILPKGASLPRFDLTFIKNEKDGLTYLVQEHGTAEIGPRGAFTLKVKSNTDNYAFGADEAGLENKIKDLNIKRQTIKTDSGNNAYQTLKCIDILKGQSSTKRAIFDRLIADNLVVTTAIIGTELTGANRLNSADGRQVILADIIGANVNSLIGAGLGKMLVVKNTNLAKSLVLRSSVAMGMIEVQKGIYGVVLQNKAEERANSIATFDRMYFLARLPIAHYSDQFILKKLPEMLFEACRKDSSIALYITPRSIRIVERYASTLLYYGLRSAVIQE